MKTMATPFPTGAVQVLGSGIFQIPYFHISVSQGTEDSRLHPDPGVLAGFHPATHSLMCGRVAPGSIPLWATSQAALITIRSCLWKHGKYIMYFSRGWRWEPIFFFQSMCFQATAGESEGDGGASHCAFRAWVGIRYIIIKKKSFKRKDSLKSSIQLHVLRYCEPCFKF